MRAFTLLRIFSLGLLTLGLGGPSASAEPKREAPVWGIDACLSVHVDHATQRAYVDRLGESGVQVLRERGVPFPDASGKATSDIPARLRELKAAGFQIVAFVSLPPEVKATQRGNALPENLAEVYAGGKRLAQLYAGIVDAWEMVGEPDVGYCRDLPDRVAAYQKALYLGIKAGGGVAKPEGGNLKPESSGNLKAGELKPELSDGPEPTQASGLSSQLSNHSQVSGFSSQVSPAVLMGALALPPGPWLERATRNGLLDYTDAYNFHSYAYADNFGAVIRSHKRWLKAQPRTDLPLWVTECGINTRRVAKQDDGRLKLQADFTVATAQEAQREGVALFMPFILVHKGDPHALTDGPDKPKPAWEAYADFTRRNAAWKPETRNLKPEPLGDLRGRDLKPEAVSDFSAKGVADRTRIDLGSIVPVAAHDGRPLEAPLRSAPRPRQGRDHLRASALRPVKTDRAIFSQEENRGQTEVIEPSSARGASSLRSVGEDKSEGARASSQPTEDGGRRTVDGRRRTVDGGRLDFSAESPEDEAALPTKHANDTKDGVAGGRSTDDGKRGTEGGGQRTVDGRRWTGDGRRWTGDGRRWTVDGGRRTEGGGPSTVYREERIIKGWSIERQVGAPKTKSFFTTENTESTENKTGSIEPSSARGASSLRSVGEDKSERARASSQPTEDGGRRTVDGRQGTEDGGRLDFSAESPEDEAALPTKHANDTKDEGTVSATSVLRIPGSAPSSKLPALSSQLPSPIVAQWLHDPESATPHKVSGTYRFRGGEPMRGVLRLYNFGSEPVTGRWTWRGMTDFVCSLPRELTVTIPAGGWMERPVEFQRGAPGYRQAWFDGRWEDASGRRSTLSFGLETTPAVEEFRSTPLAVTPTTPAFDRGAIIHDETTSRVGPWVGLNGIVIESTSEGGLRFHADQTGGASFGDALHPGFAMAGVQGLPKEGFLRLRVNELMSRDWTAWVYLIDDRGRRFTIWENAGMAYGGSRNNVWLNLRDFSAWWERVDRGGAFDPTRVRAIMVRLDTAKTGVSRELLLDVMEARRARQ